MERALARLRALDTSRPEVSDGLLGVLLVAAAAVSDMLAEGARPPDATLAALLVAAALPYPLRRRSPLPVYVVGSLPVLGLMSLGYSSAVIGAGLMLLAYSVACWRGVRQTALAGAWTLVLMAAVMIVLPSPMGFGELATNLALFGGALLAGRGSHARRDVVRLLEERAQLAEHARVEEARRAVSEERLRIAQELHDVIGHSLGVIALQAGVGAHVIDTDPAEAKASLVAVSETSRSALTEVRRILGALRTDGDSYRPPPGIDALKDLAEELTAAGLPVEVRVEGVPSHVPSALGLTAYRLVQEALTNVVRHAGPATAMVTVRYEDDAVTLEVLDDGRLPVRGTPGTGHGQLGMRERVAVWGGTLTAGPRPEGGYRVAARLPYRTEEVR